MFLLIAFIHILKQPISNFIFYNLTYLMKIDTFMLNIKFVIKKYFFKKKMFKIKLLNS